MTLTACVLLCACLDSVNPASDPATAVADPELVGDWRGTFEGDLVYLHVGRDDQAVMRGITVERRDDGIIKSSQYVGFPTQLGNLAILNLKSVDDDDLGDGYTLVRYQVDGRALTLWTLSEAAIRQDVKSGKLRGTVSSAVYGDVRITASTPELAAYLGSVDAARLFTNTLKFERVPKA